METQFIFRVTTGKELLYTGTRLYIHNHICTQVKACTYACKYLFSTNKRKICGFLTYWQAGGHEAVGQKWGAQLLGAIRRSRVGEEEEEEAA